MCDRKYTDKQVIEGLSIKSDTLSLEASLFIEQLQAENERLKNPECVFVSVNDLLSLRDELAKRDIAEAYHILYKIADPDFSSLTPWKEWETVISQPPENGG